MSRRAIAHLHAAAKDAGIGETSDEIHDRLHGWAVSLGHNSLTDMADEDMDEMARKIKRDPLVMAAWFDQFAPIEFEEMAATENADHADPSLFTDAEWKALHEDSDKIAERFRQ